MRSTQSLSLQNQTSEYVSNKKCIVCSTAAASKSPGGRSVGARQFGPHKQLAREVKMIVQLKIVTIVHKAHVRRLEWVAGPHENLKAHGSRLHSAMCVQLQSKVGGGYALLVNETEDGSV